MKMSHLQSRTRLTSVGFAMTILVAIPTWAESALTLLTMDGELRFLGNQAPRVNHRVESAEGGAGVVVDDYAVVKMSKAGQSVSFETEAFKVAPKGMVAAGRELTLSTSDGGEASKLGLLIRHQHAHDPTHNYTPTPITEFQPQRLDGDARLEGARGFAIVSIGETGMVRRVRILSDGKPVRNPDLQAAIGAGVKPSFQDEERHDHTIYFAYQVKDQEVVQVGQSLVTLPMCCCPPPPKVCP